MRRKKIQKGMLSQAFFHSRYQCLVLGLGLTFLPLLSLSADRIYLIEGSMIRGKILSISAGSYKIQSVSGKTQTIPKYDIKNILFARGKAERGYDQFFARLFGAMGLTESNIFLKSGNDIVQLKSGQASSRLGMDIGWQLINYYLALYTGFDYRTSTFYSSQDPSYNYLSYHAGLSYYFSLPFLRPLFQNLPFGKSLFENMYISAQARMFVNGSASLNYREIQSSPSFPLEGNGLGYGLSLGMEEYISDSQIWGVALTYSIDRFQNQTNFLGVSTGLNPGFPSGVDIQSKETEFTSIGITFSLTYD